MSHEAGLAPIWKYNEYDVFARYSYQRNTLSCGALLATNRNRLEIFGRFKMEEIVEIVVCTEQKRSGKEYAVIDGIEFRDMEGVLSYMGRRRWRLNVRQWRLLLNQR